MIALGIELTALDAVTFLARVNLVASLAVLAVLAARPVVRRLFGPDVAYGLWLAPPVAALGALLPAVQDFAPTAAQSLATVVESRTSVFAGDIAQRLLSGWAVGVVAAVVVLGVSQAMFLRRAARGEAGPALVGVFEPRLVVPSDFADRFSASERAMVRAHERAHIDRRDPLCNAFIAVLQCLNWFNPIVHLAAHQARLDQELACDARVMLQRPGSRRLYAETMLKTQLGSAALPLGCHWAPRSRHPLEMRVALLKQGEPGHRRRIAGVIAVLALGFAAGYGAWSMQPGVPEPEDDMIVINLRPPANGA